jgi:hypothetical protein
MGLVEEPESMHYEAHFYKHLNRRRPIHKFPCTHFFPSIAPNLPYFTTDSSRAALTFVTSCIYVPVNKQPVLASRQFGKQTATLANYTIWLLSNNKTSSSRSYFSEISINLQDFQTVKNLRRELTGSHKLNVSPAPKGKTKTVPLHAMEALGGKGCSSYSILTSALDGGE